MRCIGLSLAREVSDESRQLVRLFHLDEVPGTLDDLEARPGQDLGEALAAFQRDDAIVAAPPSTSRWNVRGASAAISAAIHPPKPRPTTEIGPTARVAASSPSIHW